ncbi:MAG: hypothetical protein JWL72_1014 [Ilumatobacteraceae bacterium]|nr:hypothetical protein [Ilumatobacteraceae bacterium]
MSDQSLRRMFDTVGGEPDAEFVARLRGQLLSRAPDRLADAPSSGAHLRSAPDELGLRRDRLVPSASWVSPRRVALIACVLGLITAAVVFGLVTRHTDEVIVPVIQPTTTTTTATSASFERPISTTLTLPDGTSFHFDARLGLPIAIESVENSTVTQTSRNDVLLLPRLSGTVRKVAGGSADVQVQIFLRTDIVPCVVNNDGACAPAIIFDLGDPTGGSPFGADIEIPDLKLVGRTSVLRADVPRVVSTVADGSLVTGYGVVMEAPTGAIASEIYDAEGRSVLTCTDQPSICMGPDRSVLHAPQGRAPAASALPPLFPPGDAPAGTYTIEEAAIGNFSMTTSSTWRQWDATSRSVLFGRGERRETEMLIGAALLTSAPTPEALLAGICPAGSVDFGSTSTTTLFGRPALAIEGTVTTQCSVSFENRPMSALAKPGEQLLIVATSINGVIEFVFAHAAPAVWTSFRGELDSTIASLTLQNG